MNTGGRAFQPFPHFPWLSPGFATYFTTLFTRVPPTSYRHDDERCLFSLACVIVPPQRALSPNQAQPTDLGLQVQLLSGSPIFDHLDDTSRNAHLSVDAV
jgi:hypothetical protein